MDDTDLKPLGWAPGMYRFKCLDVLHDDPNRPGLGAKHSVRCRECAERRFHENPAMTDTPSPSVQPVRAWAVVDKDDKISVSSCCAYFIEEMVPMFDKRFASAAPHRVIRVEIREVNDE